MRFFVTKSSTQSCFRINGLIIKVRDSTSNSLNIQAIDIRGEEERNAVTLRYKSIQHYFAQMTYTLFNSVKKHKKIKINKQGQGEE